MIYNYSLQGWEEKTILTHEKLFTKKEFTTMCKEAPMFDVDSDFPFYHEPYVEDYLMEIYGFKRLEYAAVFFVDGEVTQE